ncbi:hypothetical protein BO86DRAFT_391969 [Aspergillus japonicus CBS 114.51]|uniref:Uncharacterized protein n=1 Tax=Aspergillus japonicus CBS 114.51 TaxID=1448312 RepID=A0A8T8WR81_ASPJA|nr:hypothetical protein BO86DRAFT_391969 [Aspergillus japonicus CBS 114.51]RAH78291.1 hypothetical protein BO86DRAFT_391969 [Aspergillus japonicus CBS 114.51]
MHKRPSESESRPSIANRQEDSMREGQRGKIPITAAPSTRSRDLPIDAVTDATPRRKEERDWNYGPADRPLRCETSGSSPQSPWSHPFHRWTFPFRQAS